MADVSRVVAMFGPRRGIVRELDGRLVIGRAGEAGLQLIDDKVSREHCALDPDGDGHAVEDLGSRNGTFVNGRRIEGPVPLRPGDQIAVGESVLVYQPSFEAMRASDGDSTLILTGGGTSNPRGAGPLGTAALEQAGALALSAAMASDPDRAAELFAEAAAKALQPSGVVILRRSKGGALKPVRGFPAGAHVFVSRALVEMAVREGRPLSAPEPQARTEADAQTTRVRHDEAYVLCAPILAQGVAAGALCAVRSRQFDEQEIALAGALALAAGPALSAERAEARPTLELPVAKSAAMREAMRVAEAAAKVSSTVLITGETGTGKEELARAIHAMGARAAGPFVAVNCGAIPTELAESELFGHEKGAFTGAVSSRPGVFEQADGGTLLLDEVGDLPATLQVKLLRALQDRTVQRVGGRSPIAVDVRVIAATHRQLEAAVKSGAFREDLYWRLNVLRVHLPPLRERREDILPLAERFFGRIAASLGRRAEGFTAEARGALEACPWPGNARQLANALERALVLKSGGAIGLSDLPSEVLAPERGEVQAAAGRTLGELVRALEREQVALALRRARGVKTAAAEALGISRPTLDRKIEEYGIDIYE
ncbi:MAG: sigma 54-interacting transcriptional regulator [Myxococcales bacterium]|nr:sigma 54-interacting transcriptional regulator [Myxococcales bacterium]